MISYCLACLVLSTAVNVSDDVGQTVVKPITNRRNTLIMLQPVPLISNWAIVTVESVFSDKMSGVISLGAAYRRTTQDAPVSDASSWSSTNRSVNTSLEIGFNYFFEGLAPQGFWLGPRALFEFGWTKSTATVTPAITDFSNTSNTWRDYVVGGSLLFGYNAILHSGLSFQVGLGLGATYDWSSGAFGGTYFPATTGIGAFFAGPGLSSNAIRVSGRGVFGIGWGV